MKYLNSDQAPRVPILNQASVTERPTVFVAGQVGIIPKTSPPELEATVEDQTRRAMSYIEEALKAAGSDIGHIAMLYIQHTKQADYGAINAAYLEYMESAGVAADGLPPRVATGAAFLPLDAAVEIWATGELAGD